MAEPPKGRLQIMLEAAVQNVQWTYIIFWQFCPQQGILVWSDGYYNGPIKTRKTVQPTEVTTEEATLQRSQQLRELYESLSVGETSHQTRRPSAALSPEDLTESEWFYLMCVSFSFPPGVGLTGKAYVKRQYIWLTRANEADSKVFSRAILAKSAGIQTVVCIPLLDGVIELGTTERVEEDIGLIQRVKTFFQNPNPPRPALSEHSTSNPSTSSGPGHFQSPGTLPTYTPMKPTFRNSHVAQDQDEENEDEAYSDSEADTRRGDSQLAGAGAAHVAAGEPIELMQLDMSEDIRLGSPPDDGSNNLDSDSNLLAVSQLGNTAEHHRDRWPVKDATGVGLHPPQSGNNFPSSYELPREDTHYSQTVSTILQNQSLRSKDSSSTLSSAASVFTKWSATPSAISTPRRTLLLDGAAQWALKHILFTVPLLHTKSSRDHTSRKWAPPHSISATHVLAERRRREKLNERFIILRSLVPFITKMDKASILEDTIEYLKQLKKKIQELEAEKSGPTSGREKRKMRVAPPHTAAEVAQVEVSIIEGDALVEIECLHKEGLLFDVMKVLKEFRIEVTTVQSSVSNGIFVAELRAKVKENVNGRKPSIMEVKRSINQILR